MRFKKVLIGVAIVIIVLVIAASLGENYAEKKYSNQVIPIKDKISVIIGDIDLSLLNRGVLLREVRLIDTLNPAMIGTVDKIAVQGIDIVKIIKGEGFSIRGLKVEGLNCEIFLNRLKTDSSSVRTTDTLDHIADIDSVFVVDSVGIHEGKDTINKTLSFSAPLLHIRFDKDMQPDLKALDIKDLTFRPGQGPYKFDITSITTSENQQLIELDSFQVIPRYSNYEFGFKVGRRMASTDLVIEKIKIHDFDLQALTQDSLLSIGSIVCERANASIFADKRVPIEMNRYGALPQEALLKASLRIHIDSVTIKDADVRFSALNPETMEVGYLDFKRSYLVLRNVTNVEERIEINKSMTLDIRSNFTNTGVLNARFDFDLSSKDYRFTWSGNLQKMKLDHIDSFVIPVANLNISNGFCHGLKFNIVSDYDTSHGTMQFQYSNLKVEVLNAQHYKQRRLLSSLANMLVVKSNNLIGDKSFNDGTIKFGREMHRGFPDYVWKSLENGILHSILPEGIAKLVETQPAKAIAKEEKKNERQRKKDDKKLNKK